MTRTLALSLFATLALGCGDKEDDTGGTDGLTDDEIAADLWNDIDGYSSWSQFEGFEGVQVSEAVHGSYVQVWFNDVAVDHYTSGSGDMPDGAIVVKEGYSDEGETVTSITVMQKDATQPNSGWFWANFSEAGDINLAGDQSGCYDCHSSGQDYNLVASW